MKLLIYGLNYYPELTGAGKYTGELSNFFSKKGNDVRVITTNKYFPKWEVKQNNYKKEYINECQVYRCPIFVPKKPNGFLRIIHLLSFCISSLPILVSQKKWKPDYVVVIIPTFFSAYMLLIIKRIIFPSSKTWLHIQDLEIDAAKKLKIISTNLLSNFSQKLERKIYSEYDLVSTISEGMKNNIEKKINYQKQILLFRNWIDLKEFKPKNQKNRSKLFFTNIYKINNHDVVIMYSGSLNKKQDINCLIETIIKSSHLKNIKWILSTEGPSRYLLEKKFLNSKFVIITDLKPNKDLNEWLSIADIHVLPQKEDINDLVMPSKLIGILASGRPVIVTCKSNTEISNLINNAGLSVNPGDSESFYQAILLLYKNTKLREEYGKNARIIASQIHDKDIILNSILKELINHKSNFKK